MAGPGSQLSKGPTLVGSSSLRTSLVGNESMKSIFFWCPATQVYVAWVKVLIGNKVRWESKVVKTWSCRFPFFLPQFGAIIRCLSIFEKRKVPNLNSDSFRRIPDSIPFPHCPNWPHGLLERYFPHRPGPQNGEKKRSAVWRKQTEGLQNEAGGKSMGWNWIHVIRPWGWKFSVLGGRPSFKHDFSAEPSWRQRVSKSFWKICCFFSFEKTS